MFQASKATKHSCFFFSLSFLFKVQVTTGRRTVKLFFLQGVLKIRNKRQDKTRFRIFKILDCSRRSQVVLKGLVFSNKVFYRFD